MGNKKYLLGFFLLAVDAMFRNAEALSLTRSSFPSGFLFGAASSAYQIEGAANEDGRGPSLWDTFTHKYPEKIKDHSNGDVAIDSYHRYKDDVQTIKKLGLDAYRFSISWSRVLPRGKLSGGVNEKGIRYYNNLIDELLANGIEPYVTIFHWDTPQALEDEYGGFLSREIVTDFHRFAELCFERFGDRVKNWITVNEPWTYAVKGYDYGIYAPGRCSSWKPKNCTGGDGAIEPYLITHHILLAHASAVKLYRQKYQGSQRGKIAITLVTKWMVPYSNSTLDRAAAERVQDFWLGWYMEPLVFGDYPSIMKSMVKDRLPNFTKEESKMIKGSFDFIGLNYYTSYYAAQAAHINTVNLTYSNDYQADVTSERNGIPIGRQGASDWLFVYPRGIWDLLLHMKRKYHNPPIYITENGVDEWNNASLPVQEALKDNFRIDYLDKHLSCIQNALKVGVDVRGYFVWSIFDNFEWDIGYTSRFGINYIDYTDNLKRYKKLSAAALESFLKIHREEVASQ